VRRAAPVIAACAVLIAVILVLLVPGAQSEGGAPSARRSRLPPAAPARAAAPKVPLAHMPRAGILFNIRTGEVLWSRKPAERLRIASLTKMMTALIVAERTREDDEVEIVPSALHVGGSRVGHLPVEGELPVRTLLYGMLLPSGNDAANELAVHVAGSIPAFVAMMNERVRRFGLLCTHYAAPSGFFNQGNYSCARDLAVLAARILRSRRLARVVSTPQITLPFPNQKGEITLTNGNPLLLYHYPGAVGVKTGWTKEAGDCLVGAASRGGVTLAAILLHSPSPGLQARKLLDWAFARFYHQPTPRSPRIPPGT